MHRTHASCNPHLAFARRWRHACLPFVLATASVLGSADLVSGQVRHQNASDNAPPDDGKERFPDQRTPKAACYSLLIALIQNRADDVDAIYVGKDEAFKEFRTIFGGVCASRQRLAKVADERFGLNGALLAGDIPEPSFGGGGYGKGRLSDFIVAATVKTDGDLAEVPLAFGTTIAVKRIGEKWCVDEWGRLPLEDNLYEMSKVMTAVFDHLAQEIEDGKFERAVDAHERLHELVVAKATEQFGQEADKK